MAGSGRGTDRRKGLRAWPIWLACLPWVAASAGCVGLRANEAPLRNLVRDRVERRQERRAPADPVGGLLGQLGLLDAAQDDPAGAARALEDHLISHPEPAGALALAELSYRAGLARERGEPRQAMAWYRDAAALASMGLAEPSGTPPVAALDLHNRAVARLIRIAHDEGKSAKVRWQDVLGEQGIALGSSAPYLAPDRFADLRVASDIRVTGMDRIHRTDGLGVPLVAHRAVDPAESPDPLDLFHPRHLRTAATAILSARGGLAGYEWRRNPATLALFDPFVDQAVRVGHRDLPLAGDLTTPLAVQLAVSNLSDLEMSGLFESDFRREGAEAGLYLFRPHVPGKIPVVLVHGLFSSPRAYTQTINELASDPTLTSRFEFWVFLYPTGRPIPASAATLRASLEKARHAFDPDHADPALDRMVLIGHSMGGLLSKMMAQDSGATLWEAAFRRPIDRLNASPETRQVLEQALLYRPVASVARVVFIATPHRGSPIADQWFGRTIASLVKHSDEQTAIGKELEKLNGPDLIAPEIRRAPLNAVGNLRTDSPILRALDTIPIRPGVPYHSIIPLVGGRIDSDGVVSRASAHVDGAGSEMTFPGTHFSQQDPRVTRELRRILLEHIGMSGAEARAAALEEAPEIPVIDSPVP
ncbi:esterase/lipase family protein [Tundrisphaera sp. TA3]|uniref:esterase/lipase family protein n=1 Tax=Tundrisphaera sp. TA3 TaxID=3435775 RepID=UPI003EBBE814